MKQTDWDSYYSKPFAAARYTRKITGSTLLSFMRKYCPYQKDFHILELGGANSCFYDMIEKEFSPRSYTVIDTNQEGLDRFRDRTMDRPHIRLIKDSVLDLKSTIEADLTFSVGLIEHFSPEETEKAIHSHFALTRKGGIVIMSFPTPTFLYRATRRAAELLHLWAFHDERPLGLDEVKKATDRHGTMRARRTIWPIFLTQLMCVVQNHE